MKHKDDCKMSFGRKDQTCPRCQELLNGAEPKRGWGQTQIIGKNGKLIWATKQQQEAKTREMIKNHDCKASHCHPTVCTAFDY